MLDRYDLRFGLSRSTKRKGFFLLSYLLLNLVLVHHFFQSEAFFQYQLPKSNEEFYGAGACLNVIGILIYAFFYVFRLGREVRSFRIRKKGWLTGHPERETAVFAIQERVDLYRYLVGLDGKKRTFGSKEEADAKLFYLEKLKANVKKGADLTDYEREMLGDILFHDKDEAMLRWFQKEKRKQQTPSA